MPYGIMFSSSYINTETMKIIEINNIEITENYFLGIKLMELFAISMHIDLTHFLGYVNYLKEGSKEKTLKIK